MKNQLELFDDDKDEKKAENTPSTPLPSWIDQFAPLAKKPKANIRIGKINPNYPLTNIEVDEMCRPRGDGANDAYERDMNYDLLGEDDWDGFMY